MTRPAEGGKHTQAGQCVGRELTAIETRYKGYRFRSRTEARWAVFFDAMGVKWTYEEQGYDLGEGVAYLPDFVVLDRVFVEVKPAHLLDDPGEAEKEKWFRLAEQSYRDVLVVFGRPGDLGTRHDGVAMVYTADNDTLTAPKFGFRECRGCGGLAVVKRDGSHSLLDCHPSCTSEREPVSGLRIANAVGQARGARFEHGESTTPAKPAERWTPRVFVPRTPEQERAQQLARQMDEIDRLFALADDARKGTLLIEKQQVVAEMRALGIARWKGFNREHAST